jgi:hypothetical protein
MPLFLLQVCEKVKRYFAATRRRGHACCEGNEKEFPLPISEDSEVSGPQASLILRGKTMYSPSSRIRRVPDPAFSVNLVLLSIRWRITKDDLTGFAKTETSAAGQSRRRFTSAFRAISCKWSMAASKMEQTGTTCMGSFRGLTFYGPITQTAAYKVCAVAIEKLA